MPIDHAGAANHAVTANLQASRHNDATGYCRIVANHNVMRNLALVINDNTIADHSIVQSTTVNGGTSADLDAIADNHATKLRDLYPVTTIVRVTKPIRSNDSA